MYGYSTTKTHSSVAVKLVANPAVLSYRARIVCRKPDRGRRTDRLGPAGDQRPKQNVTIGMLRKYSNALNYTLEITIKGPESGVGLDLAESTIHL